MAASTRARAATFAAAIALILPAVGAWTSSRARMPGSSRLERRALQGRGRPVAKDDRIYSVTIDRRTGIDFGCDLSLCWPYVLALVPGGAAELCGEIAIGDQLLGVGSTNLVGAEMSAVTEVMSKAEGESMRLTLFRGGREELQQSVGYEGLPPTVSIRVVRDGQPDLAFTAPTGCNLRDELTERKVNVYRSLTRWTNCNGKQLCGTCIVDVRDGGERCSRKSLDEASTLRENPGSYRLACITQVYGDVEVRVLPEIGAAQWTR